MHNPLDPDFVPVTMEQEIDYDIARKKIARRAGRFYHLIMDEDKKGEAANQVKIEFWKARASALHALLDGFEIADAETINWIFEQDKATPDDTDERQIF